MARERRRVYYRGRVQGVGFRYTAVRVADRFEVVGTVSNLDDGRVELVAEGESAELDAFLGALAAEMHGHIRGVEIEPLTPGDPPYFDFSIRH